MALRRTLEGLTERVRTAPSMPFSSSCLVNRAEVLAELELARGELPVELEEAELVLSRRDGLLDDARREADDVRGGSERMAAAVVDGAREEADDVLGTAHRLADELVSTGAIVARAGERAEQILIAAREEAARLLRDADDYCDGRLAELEGELDAVLGQVRRGRELLGERSALGHEALPDPVGEPEPLDGAGSADEAGDAGPPHPPAQRCVVDLTGLDDDGTLEPSGLGQGTRLQ